MSVVRCPLHGVCYPLPVTAYLLPFARCLLPVVYGLSAARRPATPPRTETLHVVHVAGEGGPAVLRVGDYKVIADTNTWDASNAIW